ncbi:MAG: protein kinase [Chitinivibrionales bacterium]
MNNPQKDPGSESLGSESLGKTFVEGAGAKTGSHSLSATGRVDATSLRAANPYQGAGVAAGIATNLPSGNEPVPLGSGTIVGLLGAGGMARVYKVWNDKLEVFRAVKILIPNQQGDMRNRFETEAKITAKLHHPNIVEIYNVGDWQGLPYLEMEIIDGMSLESIISKTGKLPPSVCCAISIFMARALAYAHGQQFLLYGKNYHGIIHRDLKPANIMISSQGALKLMDFGIARPTEASLHTVDGNIVGTMQYLSPEQLDGTDIDCRADIYAFGAILYEMLTGTKTFPQETITNLMKQKILNEYRKFEDFDFSVPAGLARISQKCLQIAKENRFADANALLKELESVHRSLSPESAEFMLKAFITDPGSIPEVSHGKGPFRISRKIIIALAAVVLVGALIAVFVVTGPKPAPVEQQPAARAQTPVSQKVAPAQPPAQSQQPEPLKPLVQQEPEQKVPAQPYSHSTETKMQSKTRSGFQHAQNPKNVSLEKNNRDFHNNNQEPTSLAQLQKTYESNDLFIVGKLAMQKSSYSDAVLALSNVPRNSPDHEKSLLLLISAYMETNRSNDAQAIIQSEKINDAEYYFLAGKLLQQQGRNKEALDHFQAALTKPSNLRSIADVRNDALYYTAIAYRDMYISDPSPDNRGLALQAWLVVKNVYRNNPNSPRYRKAVEELATTK